MSHLQGISLLGGWQGFVVVGIQRQEAGVVGVELRPKTGRLPRCGGCGKKAYRVHDWAVRFAQDLPIWGSRTRLIVHSRRVLCLQCGCRTEQIDWLDRYSRVTQRLAESVVRLCEVLPIQHVAQHYGMSWNTVKRIHKTHLQQELEPADFAGITLIGMDEFAIQKGHRYATVIVDMETKRVLWVGRGRSREDIRPFFDLLGEEGCKQLKAVAMDMNGAYEEEVRSHCPDVDIIYDLYHVKAKYNRDVVERVRIDELGRVRGGRPDRKVTQNQRWLLLRSKANLTSKEDRVSLRELLSANKRIYTVYLLKEDLNHLWSYRSRAAANKFWNQWYRRAIYSKIEPLKKFARNLKTYMPGILAHCDYPIGTSLIEGINNKIKVIKRMAYGFRDDDYFFLRIRHAFPGIR